MTNELEAHAKDTDNPLVLYCLALQQRLDAVDSDSVARYRRPLKEFKQLGDALNSIDELCRESDIQLNDDFRLVFEWWHERDERLSIIESGLCDR